MLPRVSSSYLTLMSPGPRVLVLGSSEVSFYSIAPGKSHFTRCRLFPAFSQHKARYRPQVAASNRYKSALFNTCIPCSLYYSRYSPGLEPVNHPVNMFGNSRRHRPPNPVSSFSLSLWLARLNSSHSIVLEDYILITPLHDSYFVVLCWD